MFEKHLRKSDILSKDAVRQEESFNGCVWMYCLLEVNILWPHNVLLSLHVKLSCTILPLFGLCLSEMLDDSHKLQFF